MPRNIKRKAVMLTEEEEKRIKDAEADLERMHKKFYREPGERTPLGEEIAPKFSNQFLQIEYEIGERVRFIGCCPYMNDPPLDPISGLHPEGFSTPEKYIAELNEHYFGKRCLILNISAETTDGLEYFKCQFKDGIIIIPMVFEITKLHSKQQTICQGCFSKTIGKCRGASFGK